MQCNECDTFFNCIYFNTIKLWFMCTDKVIISALKLKAFDRISVLMIICNCENKYDQNVEFSTWVRLKWFRCHQLNYENHIRHLIKRDFIKCTQFSPWISSNYNSNVVLLPSFTSLATVVAFGVVHLLHF